MRVELSVLGHWDTVRKGASWDTWESSRWGENGWVSVTDCVVRGVGGLGVLRGETGRAVAGCMGMLHLDGMDTAPGWECVWAGRAPGRP